MSDFVLAAESLGKTYPLPKGALRVFEGLGFGLGRGVRHSGGPARWGGSAAASGRTARDRD